MTAYGVGGDGRPTVAAQLPTHGNAQHTVAVAPTTSAVGDAAAEGASAAVARADHLHGREAFAAGTPANVASTAAVGAGTTLSRSDHVHTIAAGVVTPAMDSVADANGLSPQETIRVAFTAGGAGADDVTIYSANAPFLFRILDSQVLISTTIAASTVQLRSASGGLGSALSDAFASDTTGRKRDTGSGISNVTPTVAANGSVFLRRTAAGVAGEVIITIRKE